MGASDAEIWKQQWDKYEDDHAVMDVDVRGWIYTPHKGPLNRKQRLFVGLSRQLAGIQAPSADARRSSASPTHSREPSPFSSYRESHQSRAAQHDQLLTAQEADEILRRGEREAEVASKGGYSERPAAVDAGDSSPYRPGTPTESRTTEYRPFSHRLTPTASNASLRLEETATAPKRSSATQPAAMSSAELAEANSHLMSRLRHFLAMPLANTPISIFFYNDQISKQRTIYTTAAGHFSIRAALDFVPSHIRILASDKLSATTPVVVTQPEGVSVISDIDDTIKHSAISSGAREIFRNAFIRELGDLTIDGVRLWYNRMAEAGVKFHYVSNSPWQLYPTISSFFAMAGLPPGSFHLKQYTGMLQGIFEPVAERKKGTLDKIVRDFPERRFILIGDSGEADLEVYTDFVLENPGRVLGIFIRDVTTSVQGRFFDPSIKPMSNPSPSSYRSAEQGQRLGQVAPKIVEADDPEIKAAIAASLQDMESDAQRPIHVEEDDHPRSRPSLPPRKTVPVSLQKPKADPIESASDLQSMAVRRVATESAADRQNSAASSVKPAPKPPRKPAALRSVSGENGAPPSASKNVPPKPRRPSSVAASSSPLSQQSQNRAGSQSNDEADTLPPRSSKPPTYSGLARNKVASAYNALPAASSLMPGSHTHASNEPANATSAPAESKKPVPPLLPPPRRGAVRTASIPLTRVPPPLQERDAQRSHTTQPSFSTGPSNSSPTLTAERSPSISSASQGQNGGSPNVYSGGASGQPPNKREQLWRSRWAKSQRILEEKGVVLRAWRVGTDVVDVALRLIQGAEELEAESKAKNRH